MELLGPFRTAEILLWVKKYVSKPKARSDGRVELRNEIPAITTG